MGNGPRATPLPPAPRPAIRAEDVAAYLTRTTGAQWSADDVKKLPHFHYCAVLAKMQKEQNAKRTRGETEMTIAERVVDIIAEESGLMPEEISADSLLREHLNFDSLDKIDLVLAIETEFDIEISEQEADTLHSVADITQLVTRKLHDQ